MKCSLTAVLILLASFSTLRGEEKKGVTLRPLLGDDFGEIIEIEGTIRDDRDTRLRKHLGYKLIEATHVNNQKMKAPVIIQLSVFTFTDIKIPSRGTKVRLRGFETGGFRGMPEEAFSDIGAVQTTGHHFQHDFQITRILSPSEPVPKRKK